MKKKLLKGLMIATPFVAVAIVAPLIYTYVNASNGKDFNSSDTTTNNGSKLFKHLYSDKTNLSLKERAIETFKKELTKEKLQKDFDIVLTNVYSSYIHLNDHLDKEAWVKNVTVVSLDNESMTAKLSINYYVDMDGKNSRDEDTVIKTKELNFKIKPTFFTTSEFDVFISNFKEEFDNNGNHFEINTDILNNFYNGENGNNNLIKRLNLQAVEGGYLGYEIKINDLSYTNSAINPKDDDIDTIELLKAPMLAPSVTITKFSEDENIPVVSNKNEALIETLKEYAKLINDNSFIGSKYETIISELKNTINSKQLLGENNIESINVVEGDKNSNSALNVSFNIQVKNSELLDSTILDSTNFNKETKTYTLNNLETNIAWLELGFDIASRPTTTITAELSRILDESIAKINKVDQNLISTIEQETKEQMNSFLNNWIKTKNLNFVSDIKFTQSELDYGIVNVTNLEFNATITFTNGIFLSNSFDEELINFQLNKEKNQLTTTYKATSNIVSISANLFMQKTISTNIQNVIKQYETEKHNQEWLNKELATKINEAILYYVLFPYVDSNNDGIKDEFLPNNVLTKNVVDNVEVNLNNNKYNIKINLKNNVYIQKLPNGLEKGISINLEKPHEIIFNN